MKSCRFLTASTALTILLALTACGGGGGTGDPPPGPATVSTLAYVVNECTLDANLNVTLRQALQIQQGDQMPITVVEHSAGPGLLWSPCVYAGTYRFGFLFANYGVFHRLGVTPDGSEVVFEVSDDDAQTLFPPNTLPAEDEGIFAVRADGSGLRRLGPASREPPYGVGNVDGRPFFVFSPNGRTIAYTDRGPSRDNADAVQIFTLDLATGKAEQVTSLPSAGPGGTYGPLFNDDQHITFFTFAKLDPDQNPGESVAVTVNTVDHTFTIARPPVAIPGSQVLPAFRITSAEVNVADLIQPGTTSKDHPDLPIQELFVIDRANNILQLTNFQRGDTFNPTLSADGQRVIFVASADPLGTNPSEDCQIFSIDRSGGDLRQLTTFHEGPSGSRSSNGCLITMPPLGCAANLLSRDTRGGALVFQSTCDPFGKNPYGTQLFAMHEDGTGLRQLTQTRGYTRRVSFEAPFPFAYPGMAIVYNYTPGR